MSRTILKKVTYDSPVDMTIKILLKNYKSKKFEVKYTKNKNDKKFSNSNN